MTHRLKIMIDRFLHDEEAAAIVEYVLILVVLATGCITAMTALGNSIGSLLGTLSTSL